jgi:hypothetical protein
MTDLPTIENRRALWRVPRYNELVISEASDDQNRLNRRASEIVS